MLQPKVAIRKTFSILGDDNQQIDSADDDITYTITVTNIGDFALTNVTVTDTIEGGVPTPLLVHSDSGGSGVNGDGILDVGEIWTFTSGDNAALLYDVTADDINYEITDGNFKISNKVFLEADWQSGSISAAGSVAVPVDKTPSIAVTKAVIGIDGGTLDGKVDSAGDVIHYQITVQNTGLVAVTV